MLHVCRVFVALAVLAGAASAQPGPDTGTQSQNSNTVQTLGSMATTLGSLIAGHGISIGGAVGLALDGFKMFSGMANGSTEPAAPTEPTAPLDNNVPFQPPMPRPPMPPPPGSGRASFVSASELQWDVTLDRWPACSTPCQLVVPPLSFVTLHSQEETPVRLELGHVPPHTQLEVVAEPLHRGEYATGVTFTTLGATSLVTGIALGAVGYGTDSSGLKIAGWACAIPGALVMTGSIWLMRHALPRLHVRAIGPGAVAF